MTESLLALVEFQVRSETTSQSAWLEQWGQRAADARDGEPGTQAYGALTNTTDPNSILVFERYDDQAALQAHIDRPAHAELTRNMGERNMTRRRVMTAVGSDLPHGWWSRTEHDASGNEVVMHVFNMRFDDPAKEPAFLAMADEHIAWCANNEPGSLIMSITRARQDADREVDLKAGDLLLVNAYASEAAAQAHHECPEHVAFSNRVKAEGVAPENYFFRTYQGTGAGFLWRE